MHSLISGGDKIKMLFTAKNDVSWFFLSSTNYLSIWGKCLWTFSITFSNLNYSKPLKYQVLNQIYKKIFLNIHRKIGSNQTSNAKKYIPKLLHIRSSTSNTSTYTSDSESYRTFKLKPTLFFPPRTEKQTLFTPKVWRFWFLLINGKLQL